MSLATTGVAVFLLTMGFEKLSFEEATMILLTLIVATVVNIPVLIAVRASRGNRCQQCGVRMPEILKVKYCDDCEGKYGFSEAKQAAGDVIQKHVRQWNMKNGRDYY